jgi:hypothetical protein
MRFADWRDPQGAVRWTEEWLDRSFSFDVEHNSWWPLSWEKRPADTDEAIRITREALASAPPLVHIFGHRFMTTEPRGLGNPVLSVYQAIDTVFYGYDLAHYLHKEFRIEKPPWAASAPPRVPVWGDLFDLHSEWSPPRRG